MREGTLIDYRLRLHGVPLQWRSLVEVPRAYLLIAIFTVAAAGWRYREMRRGNLLWLPDAEDLAPGPTPDHHEPASVG